MRVQRLTRQADIDRIRAQGRSHGTPLFVAIAFRREGGPARVGVAAGRRIGKAVQRNRAKRLLREGFRPLYGRVESGWDVFLIARSAILEVKSPHVTAQLEHTLARLRVIGATHAPRQETP
jgi:ribonuclease P protein component